MSYKRILAAADESSTSAHAIHEAVKLAKDMHAALRIVYVADAFVIIGEGVPFDFEKHESTIREHSESVLKKVKTLADKEQIPYETSLIINTETDTLISELILKEAAAWHADLIVMGTHGRKGVSHVVLGSVAEGVLHDAPVPVLLVRK
jgi:nucleotide-binding universal stress UspA family protein